MNLPRNVEFDATVRYVSRLKPLDVPSYVALDLRLAWRPTPHLEIAVVGRNLLDPAHPEFSESLVNSQNNEIERSVYGKVTWRF